MFLTYAIYLKILPDIINSKNNFIFFSPIALSKTLTKKYELNEIDSF